MGFFLTDAINLKIFNDDMNKLLNKINYLDSFYDKFTIEFADELAKVWASPRGHLKSNTICVYLENAKEHIHKQWNLAISHISDAAKSWAEGHSVLDKFTFTFEPLSEVNDVSLTRVPLDINGLTGMNKELVMELREGCLKNLETFALLVDDIQILKFGIFDSKGAIDAEIKNLVSEVKGILESDAYTVRNTIEAGINEEIDNVELGADRASHIMEYKENSDKINKVETQVNKINDYFRNKDNDSQGSDSSNSEPSKNVNTVESKTAEAPSTPIYKPTERNNDRVSFF